MRKSFSNEELTIINFYNRESRENLISELENVLPHIVEYEVELDVENIIKKLKVMTDHEFNKVDFNYVLEIEE